MLSLAARTASTTTVLALAALAGPALAQAEYRHIERADDTVAVLGAQSDDVSVPNPVWQRHTGLQCTGTTLSAYNPAREQGGNMPSENALKVDFANSEIVLTSPLGSTYSETISSKLLTKAGRDIKQTLLISSGRIIQLAPNPDGPGFTADIVGRDRGRITNIAFDCTAIG